MKTSIEGRVKVAKLELNKATRLDLGANEAPSVF
jgi:hypothetical protein